MSLLLIEGFRSWAMPTAAEEGWAVTGTPSITDGARAGSKAFTATTYPQRIHKSFSAAAGTFYFCARFRPDLLADERPILDFREGSTSHILVGINGAGRLVVWRGSTGTTLAIGTFVCAQGAWVQITGKIVCADSGGSVEIRVNGGVTPDITFTGDTQNGGTGVCDSLGLNGSSGTTLFALHDLAVWSAAGESPNDWVGDVRVDEYFPTADGSSTDFTPSAGANYQCVNHTSSDGDASYVESATNGHVDLYQTGDMAHTPTVIHAVAVTALARKTDAGSASLKLKMKSAATTDNGAATALAEGSYSRAIHARGVDPSTSSAWTKAAVNALEVGIEAVI